MNGPLLACLGLLLCCALSQAPRITTPAVPQKQEGARATRSLTTVAVRQTQPNARRSTLHYISFIAELGGGFDAPEKYIGRGDLKVQLSDRELDSLLRLTNRVHSETLTFKPNAKYEPLRTRLVVERGANDILLAVDQTGVVRRDGVEYRLTPLEFVRLYSFLNRLAAYHGQEVEPEPRRKVASLPATKLHGNGKIAKP